MRSVVNLAILLCCFNRSVVSLDLACHSESCQVSTSLDPPSNSQCLLTKYQWGRDCAKLRFEDFDQYVPKDHPTKFSLHAYTIERSDEEVTAFNLSITNANFFSAVVRYRNLLNANLSVCTRIQLYGNKTRPAPNELFIACAFTLDESLPYRLDYFVTGETYNYTKHYVFNVPKHEFIGNGIELKKYEPFMYVDISYAPSFLLHVQPLPESYNVTEYKIWVIDVDLGSVVDTKVFSQTSKQDNWYNFTGRTGNFSFNVSAVHPHCGEYGCANGTTPSITIKELSRHRLLIMIVSTVWIPPVALYVLYQFYKFFRREAFKRKRKPNCLLVYSPTRLTHINAMIELAKYLRNGNVAVVDSIDAMDAIENDPEYWCDSAFRDADVVLVATSPPPKKPVASSLNCRSSDNYLLNLIRETRCLEEKRFYIVQLPYCSPEDSPEELRHLKKFCLPKDLPRLLKVIHKMEQMGCVSVCDKEFLDSVKLAKLEILEENGKLVKETRETENLLTSESAQTLDNQNSMTEGNTVPLSFMTNIHELNLLGEVEERDKTVAYERSANDNVDAFRIEQLDL